MCAQKIRWTWGQKVWDGPEEVVLVEEARMASSVIDAEAGAGEYYPAVDSGPGGPLLGHQAPEN